MVNRFPTERVNNFSDAIFAIAITLLVLEVKIPPTDDIESFGLSAAMERLIPSFIGLVVSFFVTALYWRSHLTLAQFIKTYDSRMLWLNLWLLLFVVLLPFSTALYSKNFNYNGPFIFYCANLVLIGVFNYLMTIRTIKTTSSGLLTDEVAKWMKFRASIAPIVWLLSAFLAYPFPLFARFAFLLIFILFFFGEKRFKKKVA